MTEFSVVYENFLSKITDDMYMEMTVEDTEAMLQPLLLSALHYFEFPRQNIFDYDIETETFSVDLTNEEVNILGTYMVVEWMSQQLASVENTRMKYSGSDFKFTSQANHMSKILTVKKDYERLGFHLQRLYKRRKADENGIIFHTASTKDVFKQITNNPKAELCFNANGKQVRVTGTLEVIQDEKLKEEIFNHPSRKFLQAWKEMGIDNLLQILVIFISLFFIYIKTITNVFISYTLLCFRPMF